MDVMVCGLALAFAALIMGLVAACRRLEAKK